MMTKKTTILIPIFTFAFVIFLLPNVSAVDPRYGQAPRTCETVPKTTLTLNDAMARRASQHHPVGVTCTERVVVEANQTYVLSSGIVVNGELEFEDMPGATTTLQAGFVVVQGAIKAGSIISPFKSQLNIILHDVNVDLELTRRTTNTNYPEKVNFGRKAFAAYGGHVQLVADAPGPVYTKLVKTINSGDTSIYVQGNMVPFWKVGDKLAIASGSIKNDADSWVTIKSIGFDAASSSTVVETIETFDKQHEVRFLYSHKPSGKYYHFLAPEVMKTNRNIKITGMPLETDLDAWLDTKQADPIGGHFIISFSGGKQLVTGVEFAAMGQAGRLGKYPLHFHFGGTVNPASKFSLNSIHHSKQRCLVVHATDRLMVHNNAAFRTAGHCYMTEDGIEQQNFFVGNIGMATRTAIALIEPTMTDNRAATFWMASPLNHFIGNVAAGSFDGGFWFEPPAVVGGGAAKNKVPGFDTFRPINSAFGVFNHNVAHSGGVGLMTYPGGAFVPFKAQAHLQNMYVWSSYRGWLTLQGSNQKLTNGRFIDIYMVGIQTQAALGHTLDNVEIIGAQANKNLCFPKSTAIHFENHVSPISWKTGISGWKVSNVYIQDYSSKNSCAAKNLAINIVNSKENEWFPSSTYLKDFTYHNVDTIFEVDYKASKPKQLAFRVSNIGLPGILPPEDGYVIHKGFEGDSIVATLGCAPRMGLDPKLVFCPNKCVRMLTFAYMETPGMNSAKVFFISQATGQGVLETPRVSIRHAEGINVNRIITRLFEPGKYTIIILNSANQGVPTTTYSKDTVRMYRTDEVDGVPACDAKVDFQLVHETEALPTLH